MTTDANNKIDLTKIELKEKAPPLEEKDMHLLSQLPYPLPKRYIELLKISNGGCFEKASFDFYNECFKHNDSNGAEEFYGLLGIEEGYNSIIYCNQEENLPEFLSKGLLMFAGTGGGDYICFDYRDNTQSDNPPIVYWSHEANEGEDIFSR